jgi:short-subunit dehydrogenase
MKVEKFAVITGGSGGIGYEFAEVYAEQNLEVLIGRRP